MDDHEQERQEPPVPGDEDVDDLDPEGRESPTGDDEVVPGDESDPEGAFVPTEEEEVDDLDRGAVLDAPPRAADPARDTKTTRGHRRKWSEQRRWRRWAWWALIITTIGVGWALVLATVFIVRSGDRTAELLSLVEEGQQQRQAASGSAQEIQEEREAALKNQQRESQMFRAQELAALAEQAKSNAQARQALVDAGLAGSKTNTADSEARKADSETKKADAEAALAQAQAEAEAARAAAGSDGGPTADALAALAASIERLEEAIKEVDTPEPEPGPCKGPNATSKPKEDDSGCPGVDVVAPAGP